MADPATRDSQRLDDALAQEQEAVRERIAHAGTRRADPHPSVIERRRTGRIARAYVTREELGTWIAPEDRADPVALLRSQDRSRVKELVPVRHARMAASPFGFYRGSALVMASDLAAGPRSGLDAQLCGDAHLANFGLFASPDRTVLFDVNDFDESHPGPFEWDVKRLATSFVLVARDNGWDDEAGCRAAQAACRAYRASMASYAGMREIDLWYERVDVDGLLAAIRLLPQGIAGAKARRMVRRSREKARSRDSWSAIERFTEVVGGQRRFRHDPPLLVRLELTEQLRAMVNGLFRDYRATLQDDRQRLLQRYRIADVGHKVVGVGSVGLLAFVLLMRGRDDDDLMVLQVKQAQPSVLERFTRPSGFSKHGHRVVTGQRLMQAASDSFLGWIDGPGGRSFYVRQLRDMKWSPDPAMLRPPRLHRYAMLCGHALARAHARSGDAVAISAYLGSGRRFDRSIAAFASGYADQVQRDFDAFAAAVADGRIVAREDAEGAQGIRAVRRLARPARTRAGDADPAPDALPAVAPGAPPARAAGSAVEAPSVSAGPAAGSARARGRTGPNAVPRPRRPSPWTSVPAIRFADGALNRTQWPG